MTPEIRGRAQKQEREPSGFAEMEARRQTHIPGSRVIGRNSLQAADPGNPRRGSWFLCRQQDITACPNESNVSGCRGLGDARCSWVALCRDGSVFSTEFEISYGRLHTVNTDVQAETAIAKDGA